MSLSFQKSNDIVDDDKVFMPTYNSKRRRSKVSTKPVVKNPGNSDSNVMVGPGEVVGGVFDKVQLTKLLINTLKEMGYGESALKLEKESGGIKVESINVHNLISLLESGKFELIDLRLLAKVPLKNKTSILDEYLTNSNGDIPHVPNGDRNTSNILDSMNKNVVTFQGIVEDVLNKYNSKFSNVNLADLLYLKVIVEILVLFNRQIFFELVLENEDISTAVTFLRTIMRVLIKIWETLLLVKDRANLMMEEEDHLTFTPENVLKEMTTTLTSSTIMKNDPASPWKGSKDNSRKYTVEMISNYIDPEDLVPKGRLISLLKQAVRYQRSQDALNIIDEEDDEKNLNEKRRINLLQDSIDSYNNLKFEELKTLSYTVDEIWYLQFSPDGKYLASSSANSLYDRKIILYDVENDFQIYKVLGGNDQCILYLSFSPDSKYIVSCPFSEMANVYDISKEGSPIEIEDDSGTPISTVLLQPIHSFQIPNRTIAPSAPPHSVTADSNGGNGNSNSGNTQASSNSTPQSSNSDNSMANVNTNPPRIWCCDWFHTSEQQGRFAIGSPDREVVFYDINLGHSIFRMAGTSTVRTKEAAHYVILPQVEKFPRVHDLKITEDDKYLLLMTHQGHLDVYDLSKFPRKNLGSSFDNTSIFENFGLTRINRIDIDKKMTCISLAQLNEPNDPISSLVLVSLQCNELQLWDFKEGILIQKFYGQKQEQFIIRSCFGYKNNLVVSGSEDGKIFIWDRINGNIVGVLTGHAEKREYSTKKIEKNCNVVTWNPKNKKQFASGGDDGYIKIWKVIKE